LFAKLSKMSKMSAQSPRNSWWWRVRLTLRNVLHRICPSKEDEISFLQNLSMHSLENTSSKLGGTSGLTRH